MLKLKPVVATLCALGVAAIGTSFAAPQNSHAQINSQINNLQMQVARLQAQMGKMNQHGMSAHGNNAGSSLSGMVGTYAPLSQQLLTNYAGVGREMYILQARKAGKINNGLYFGGQMQADAIYQNASDAGMFMNPVFSSISSVTVGHENNTHLALTSVKLDAIAALNDWATGYIQIGSNALGNDVSYGGNSLDNDTVTVQKAYLLLGDLAKEPVYGFVGRKGIDFGQFATVNMYSQPLTRAAFQATGNTAGIGFDQQGFDAVLSIMNGGNHIGDVSVTNVILGSNLRTKNSAQINNFAVNLGYGMTQENMTWHVGAGYLNGSAYSKDDNGTNGAWDLNAKLSANNFDLMAEWLDTTSKTQFVGNNSTGHVMAWNLAADYKMPVMGHNSVLSASFSNLQLSRNASQLVLGARTEAMKNVWAGVEYSYNHHILSYDGQGLMVLDNDGNNSSSDNTLLFDVTAVF